MAGVISGIGRVLGRQPLICSQYILPGILPSRNIMGKTMRGNLKRPMKPGPYPYKHKSYGLLQAIFDKTTDRLDENSKIIVVEGPIAAGKTDLAKALAEELDMYYMPEANMDMIYINPYCYDMRELDAKLPPNIRSFDVGNFCRDPKHRLAARFQIQMYMLRYSQYIDALAHVLSTGQGVVMDRCCYSDFVFLETMYKNGYISKGARSVYYELRQNTIKELLQPHLVIYLDVPAKIVKERIEKRKINYEENSKALTIEYIQDMESIYKQNYLKDISVHAELLVYDWSNFGDGEVVMEDIERINFERHEDDRHNKKMIDWRCGLEWDWNQRRMQYSKDKWMLMQYFNVPRFDVPELLNDGDEGKIWREAWFDAPGMRYITGYNEDMGDKDILFKRQMDLHSRT